MVSLQSIRGSNERVAGELPAKCVAVFPGGTNGIGAATVRRMATAFKQPRFYIIGRSQEAADKLIADVKKLNPAGEYTFIQSDVSLLKNVDAVCHQIREKETAVNCLILTIGSFELGRKTDEGLHYPTALAYYSRVRFIENLLPLIQKADALRRVVTVLGGTREGNVNTSDWGSETAKMKQFQAQVASMMTMSLITLQERAKDVSFIHDYPGLIKTGITRGMKGLSKLAFNIHVALNKIPIEETGELHTFLATSSRFAAANTDGYLPGVGIPPAVDTGRAFFVGQGIDGKEGSGVYAVNETGQTKPPRIGGPEIGPPPNAEKMMNQFKKKGTVDELAKHTQDEFRRITGSAAA